MLRVAKGGSSFCVGRLRSWLPPREFLSDLGVDQGSIRVETFGGPGAVLEPTRPDPPQGTFSVEFARSGKTVAVGQGQTLLEAAVENGVLIPSACRQGQ